jgi:hypothetical protein
MNVFSLLFIIIISLLFFFLKKKKKKEKGEMSMYRKSKCRKKDYIHKNEIRDLNMTLSGDLVVGSGTLLISNMILLFLEFSEII